MTDAPKTTPARSIGDAGKYAWYAEMVRSAQVTHQIALLTLPIEEKARRFDSMVRASFSHTKGKYGNDRDLLARLHPRNTLDIRRRFDGKEEWFECDWLTNVFNARDGRG